MSKIHFIVIVLNLLLCKTVFAQEQSKLTIPSSPAFGILNYEPSSVMRPTNVKSLSTDILNSFDEDGKLLVNLGLEVSPYWLGSHPELTLDTYLKPNLGQTVLQSFSLSAATVKDSVSGDNKLGAGFRFKLYNGEPAITDIAAAGADVKTRSAILAAIQTEKLLVSSGLHNSKQEAIKGIKDHLAGQMSQTLIDDVIKMGNTIIGDFGDSPAAIDSMLEKLTVNMDRTYKVYREKFSDLLYQRKGLIVELAGASGFNTSDKYSVERIGLWGNMSYNISPDDLFSLTARYMYQKRDTSLSNFDIGIGFLKKNSKYNISLEAMLRWLRADIPDVNLSSQQITRVEKKFTYRVAAQGSYPISKDLNINLSFGKDFDSPYISSSGIFSILGLNYSIFSREPERLNAGESSR